ncbi:hypothetical protein TNCV_5139391 [Trichonephila clavipes]|nr:hypothetical protein TNCV_5139391 [Trichonephila clavipes]
MSEIQEGTNDITLGGGARYYIRYATIKEDLVQPIECLLSQCHGPITAKPFRHHIDIPAKTVMKKILDLITTPHCHLRSTNKETLSQAGPPTQGLSNNLDMGWSNTSCSISQ